MPTRIPKVSVCIPVYNGADYIAESVASVLAQTYRDFRLIVCDNCSTDGTADIVRNFRDPRLTYLRNRENLGLVGNYNNALRIVEGEYICFWHHDDVMLAENLERKVRALDAHPNVGYVHSDVIEIDKDGQLLRDWWWNSRRDYVEDGLAFFHKFITNLRFGAMVFIGAVLARRTCYERVGGFRTDLRYAHDSEMWMRMSLFYDVACLGTPLVKWRQHQTSASTGLGYDVPWLEEHYRAAQIILSDYRDRIPEWNRIRLQVLTSFADRALSQGWDAYHNDKFVLSKAYLLLTVRVYPQIIRRAKFWQLAIRLAAVPNGVRLYRSLRGRLRGVPPDVG